MSIICFTLRLQSFTCTLIESCFKILLCFIQNLWHKFIFCRSIEDWIPKVGINQSAKVNTRLWVNVNQKPSYSSWKVNISLETLLQTVRLVNLKPCKLSHQTGKTLTSGLQICNQSTSIRRVWVLSFESVVNKLKNTY